jgi:hypothetical protein
MNDILNSLQIYGDDRLAAMAFATILVLSVGIIGAAAMARVLGKNVLVALVVAAAVVVVVYRVTQ